MIFIALEECRSGMFIALDVVNLSGHPILTAGTELTPEHILRLGARGITRIAVMTPLDYGDVADHSLQSISAAPHLTPATRELYRHVNLKHPFIHELVRLCTPCDPQKK